MNANVSSKGSTKLKGQKNTKLTLDVYHNNHLQKIEIMQSEKNRHIQEIKDIELMIKEKEEELLSTDDFSVREHMVTSLVALKDRMLYLHQVVDDIDDKYNIEKYMTTAGNVLYEYYDLIDKGCNGDVSRQTAQQQGILKYFCTYPTEETKEDSSPEKTRGSLLDEYLRLTSEQCPSSSKTDQNICTDVCNNCGASDLVTIVNDGCLYCSKCHSIEYVVVDHEKPSYRDPPKEVSFYSYKRDNHLNEWLCQIQGKETTEIPEDVYCMIMDEIKKQRIVNMANVTHKKIREILSKLEISKYEHVPHIVSRLTGKPMKQMPSDLEDKLRNMFKQMQTPYVKHAPKDRKNFLSYSYIIRKMLELLGQEKYIETFSISIHKSKEKVYEHDVVWRKICKDLNWKYYATI